MGGHLVNVKDTPLNYHWQQLSHRYCKGYVQGSGGLASRVLGIWKFILANANNENELGEIRELERGRE